MMISMGGGEGWRKKTGWRPMISIGMKGKGPQERRPQLLSLIYTSHTLIHTSHTLIYRSLSQTAHFSRATKGAAEARSFTWTMGTGELSPTGISLCVCGSTYLQCASLMETFFRPSPKDCRLRYDDKRAFLFSCLYCHEWVCGRRSEG